MDVISLLRTRFLVVKESTLKGLIDKLREAKFNLMGAQEEIGRARQTAQQWQDKCHSAVADIRTADATLVQVEAELRQSEETKVLAVAQLDTVKEEVGYLKEQIKIYQQRLGLLPQERQGQTESVVQKPLRTARVPFAIAAANIETQQREAYWKERAERASEGITSKTSATTPTVSDKEPQ